MNMYQVIDGNERGVDGRVVELRCTGVNEHRVHSVWRT